ncbi:hypothetical protein N7516_001508 [Penicillium verrucosum]|uniref:uncharacterized protein n=1 Tax=Penicillium verrucosum TaxID=60171 RepID=UPI0025459694|nr:uncharacterized protein N7516_001508 [Penicillium verrucosum]KAJ5941340.1 hypothetical protein N7516_001508 [Penicillium verrucosum]
MASSDTSVCWSALYTCFPAAREAIKGSTVDEPSNGFLLAASLHSLFGKKVDVVEDEDRDEEENTRREGGA